MCRRLTLAGHSYSRHCRSLLLNDAPTGARTSGAEPVGVFCKVRGHLAELLATDQGNGFALALFAHDSVAEGLGDLCRGRGAEQR
jgi:hypothetical protein